MAERLGRACPAVADGAWSSPTPPESSIVESPYRPLYVGFVGSTGLEVGVLAEALAAAYDVDLAVTARAADLLGRKR